MKKNRNENPTIIFVCEHGTAKSVIAATYFNKLASEKNLNIRAVSRGTHPDEEFSSKTIAGLREDGLLPTEPTPHKLSLTDVESALSIVSFCELPEEYRNQVPVQRWDDVPPVSESYEKARDAIITRLNHLMNNMQPISKGE